MQYHSACPSMAQCLRVRYGTMDCSVLETENMNTAMVKSIPAMLAHTAPWKGDMAESKDLYGLGLGVRKVRPSQYIAVE